MDVGVIDVGSHTVRLLLARRANGRIQPLRQEKAALGLGAEVERLGRLSDEQQRTLWGTQAFYRVFSTVNGGRRRESDLFEGVS